MQSSASASTSGGVSGVCFQERFFRPLQSSLHARCCCRLHFPEQGGFDRVVSAAENSLRWPEVVRHEVCMREVPLPHNSEDFRITGLHNILLQEQNFLYVTLTPREDEERCHILCVSLQYEEAGRFGGDGTYSLTLVQDFSCGYCPLDMQHIAQDNGAMSLLVLGSDKLLHTYAVDASTGLLRRSYSSRHRHMKHEWARRLDLSSHVTEGKVENTPQAQQGAPLRLLCERWDGDAVAGTSGGTQGLVGHVDGLLCWDRQDDPPIVHVPECNSNPQKESTGHTTADSLPMKDDDEKNKGPEDSTDGCINSVSSPKSNAVADIQSHEGSEYHEREEIVQMTDLNVDSVKSVSETRDNEYPVRLDGHDMKSNQDQKDNDEVAEIMVDGICVKSVLERSDETVLAEEQLHKLTVQDEDSNKEHGEEVNEPNLSQEEQERDDLEEMAAYSVGNGQVEVVVNQVGQEAQHRIAVGWSKWMGHLSPIPEGEDEDDDSLPPDFRLISANYQRAIAAGTALQRLLTAPPRFYYLGRENQQQIVHNAWVARKNALLLDGCISCMKFYHRERAASRMFRRVHRVVKATVTADVAPLENAEGAEAWFLENSEDGGDALCEEPVSASVPAPAVLIGSADGGVALLSLQGDRVKALLLPPPRMSGMGNCILPLSTQPPSGTEQILSQPALATSTPANERVPVGGLGNVVTALCVADVTGDNCNEIIVGYQDGCVRVAKLVEKITCTTTSATRNTESWSVDNLDFADISQIKLPFPVVCIEFGQLLGCKFNEAQTGDNVLAIFHQQLVVYTTRSVHVFSIHRSKK